MRTIKKYKDLKRGLYTFEISRFHEFTFIERYAPGDSIERPDVDFEQTYYEQYTQEEIHVDAATEMFGVKQSP